jgi:hypothetical protein
MRPGCLINIVPAAGVTVQVEASSGCTCYHAVQATVVFVPRDAVAPASVGREASGR